MSAFVVIAGGSEEANATRMIARDAQRAPDGTRVIATPDITFAHAFLALAPDEIHDQPFTRGDVTLVADARIDERERRLTDAAQIAAAYEKHGVDCAAQLIGDFAFVLWDARERRLIAARDFIGVKPLYYAIAGERLIIASNISTLLLHPDVSDDLHEGALASFLIGSTSDYPVDTFYARIKRLPPAHTLTWSNGRIEIRRYWSLPLDGRIRYRDEREYLAHFRSVFDRAVSDRVRGNDVAVLMSGGLDSTAIAATAAVVRRVPIDAYTTNYSALCEDAEAEVAGRVAAMHGMRHHIAAYDDPKLFSDPDAFTRAEPLEDPLAADFLDIARDAAKHSRTLLTGIGGDVIFYTSHRHFRGLIARGRLDVFLAEVVAYWRRTGRRPPLNLRAPIKQLFGAKPWRAVFPRWIRDEVARRYELRERFDRQMPLSELHPLRPEAHRSLVHPYWPRFCETWDVGETGLALDVAYPMFDRRLVELLFAFPPMPWFANKYLLRESMRGRLPESVRERPKTPLPGDPMAIAYAASGDVLAQLRAAPAAELIDIDTLMSSLNAGGGLDAYAPHALALLRWSQFRNGLMRL